MTIKDMLTDEEQDVIIRALKAHGAAIENLVFNMRNQEAREKYNQEQTLIYDLIDRLK